MPIMSRSSFPRTPLGVAIDRTIRFGVIPLVVFLGLIGLVRYVVTGVGQTTQLPQREQALDDSQ